MKKHITSCIQHTWREVSTDRFEFICDMGLKNDPKILGYRVNRNHIRRAAEGILISVPQNKVKQKNPGYRLKTGFSMETHVPLGQLH